MKHREIKCFAFWERYQGGGSQSLGRGGEHAGCRSAEQSMACSTAPSVIKGGLQEGSVFFEHRLRGVVGGAEVHKLSPHQPCCPFFARDVGMDVGLVPPILASGRMELGRFG